MADRCAIDEELARHMEDVRLGRKQLTEPEEERFRGGMTVGETVFEKAELSFEEHEAESGF